MRKAELVFIPATGAGHLVSTVEIAKILINRDQRLSITVLIMKQPFDTSLNTYAQSLQTTANDRLRFVDLPQDDSTATMSSLTSFYESHTARVRDAVADIITRSEDSGRLAGFVIDMFCTSMIDVANEFGVPSYVFFTSNTSLLGLLLHLQCLADDHNQDITRYKDSHAQLSVPCFVNPVPAKVLPSVVVDKESSALFVSIARRIRETKGIMVNTFLELETYAIKSLVVDGKIPTVYPVGPILSVEGPKSDHDIISWLDKQPTSSVVFLCFGSMGCFDEEQVKEIATALERSRHRFLWSLRRPPPKGKTAPPTDYLTPAEVLPEGFLERTAEIGKVIGWAPQAAVLSHLAVGGFVSHCGWNSTLESLWCGVPMATWPLYAEQQMNAFKMVKELEMAVEIKLDYRTDHSNDKDPVMVTAEEIEGGIKRLMEGESEIRKKVREMKEKSRMAMTESGSSYASLGCLIQDIIDNIPDHGFSIN